MSNQSHLNLAIRFATALALVAAVMTLPIRPAITAIGRGNSEIDCLHRNIAIPGKATTHHRPTAPVNSRVVQVKALSSSSKLSRTACVVGRCLGLTSPPSRLPDRLSSTLTSGLDRAAHPLRC
jgi:hypothetical protein